MSKETNLSEEAQNSQNQHPQYTEEQMAEMRLRMKHFYEAELPYLELQEKYERLQADIEEHKVRRMTMMIRGAQMYAAGEAAEREAEQAKEALKKNTEAANSAKEEAPLKVFKEESTGKKERVLKS